MTYVDHLNELSIGEREGTAKRDILESQITAEDQRAAILSGAVDIIRLECPFFGMLHVYTHNRGLTIIPDSQWNNIKSIRASAYR